MCFNTLTYPSITSITHLYHMGKSLQTLALFGKIFTLSNYMVHGIQFHFFQQIMEQPDDSLNNLDLLSCYSLDYLSNDHTHALN
jgi:hypothetical protein